MLELNLDNKMNLFHSLFSENEIVEMWGLATSPNVSFMETKEFEAAVGGFDIFVDYEDMKKFDLNRKEEKVVRRIAEIVRQKRRLLEKRLG